MKKIIAIFVCAAIGILLSGCSFNDKNSQSISSFDSETSAVSQSSVAKKSITSNKDTVSEQEIRTLMDKNIDCMCNIFRLNTLPTTCIEIKANIFQVNNERFQDYQSFENYIRSIYCENTANMYLYNYPYENNPLYLNIDNILCINKDNIRKVGYFVDWSDYSITINNIEKDKCDFTLTAKQTEPGEDTASIDYIVAASLIKENDKWLLNKMVY